ncbi:MAG: hypothetical protein ACPGVO_01420 [Spirulinaceae cyanobacterium]
MAAFFRQFIAPLFVVLIFIVALVAVSARIFLPGDLQAPAPVSDADRAAVSRVVEPTATTP